MAEISDGIEVAHTQAQQAQVASAHVAGRHVQGGWQVRIEAINAGELEALADDRQPGM